MNSRFDRHDHHGAPARSASICGVAKDRMNRGFAPPAEIYQSQYRVKIDWNEFPAWARPADPDMFDGCCHEG